MPKTSFLTFSHIRQHDRTICNNKKYIFVADDDFGNTYWDHLYRKRPAAEVDEMDVQNFSCGKKKRPKLIYISTSSKLINSITSNRRAYLSNEIDNSIVHKDLPDSLWCNMSATH